MLENWFEVARSPGKRRTLVCDFLQGISYLNINFHVLEFPLNRASGRKSETTLAVSIFVVLFTVVVCSLMLYYSIFMLFMFYCPFAGCLRCLHTQYWNVLNEWTFYVFFFSFSYSIFNRVTKADFCRAHKNFSRIVFLFAKFFTLFMANLGEVTGWRLLLVFYVFLCFFFLSEILSILVLLMAFKIKVLGFIQQYLFIWLIIVSL